MSGTKSPSQVRAVELFFYEELCKLEGHSVAADWLGTALSRNASRKNSSPVLSIRLSGSKDCSKDSRSRKSESPRSRAAVKHVDVFESRDNMQKDMVQPMIHLDQLPNLPCEMTSSDKAALKSDSSSPRSASPTAFDEARFGLIFTDAAHAVLDHMQFNKASGLRTWL